MNGLFFCLFLFVKSNATNKWITDQMLCFSHSSCVLVFGGRKTEDSIRALAFAYFVVVFVFISKVLDRNIFAKMNYLPSDHV